MEITKQKAKKRVLKFLQQHKTAVIATISPDNKPQAATITYILDDDFSFYFMTKKNSRKFKNILHNPDVGIVVGTDPKIPATAQMEGEAHVIKDPHHFMVNYLSKAITIADPEWWPLLKPRGVDYAFFKVTITWLRWLNLDITGYPETYQEDFHQIIP